jgi:hypothetical protein
MFSSRWSSAEKCGDWCFCKPNGRVDLVYRFTPILGSLVTQGGEIGPFMYAGWDMPFPAGIRIARAYVAVTFAIGAHIHIYIYIVYMGTAYPLPSEKALSNPHCTPLD